MRVFLFCFGSCFHLTTIPKLVYFREPLHVMHLSIDVKPQGGGGSTRGNLIQRAFPRVGILTLRAHLFGIFRNKNLFRNIFQK